MPEPSTSPGDPPRTSEEAPEEARRLPSHLERGPRGERARMVDVGAKPASDRSALARARVRFPGTSLAAILAGGGPKGPIEEVARTAGILAAKRTAELIPMCHPLGLDHVEVHFERVASDLLEVRCRARCHGRTGVEMEALLGAAVAALTVYDMAKGLEPGIAIERVELVEKSGGRSGTWRSPQP
jgi:cyclic pyranopterin phosphate synthase